MKTVQLTTMSLVAAFLLAPTFLSASPTAKRPANYSEFNVSTNDKAAMQGATDKACMAAALRRPNDLALQVDCNKALTLRLNTRVREAIIRTTPRAMSARQRQFSTDQRIWAESHVKDCEEKWKSELLPTSTSFDLAVSQCVVQETYRRAIWIERYRR